jgi:hypothetical protein
MIYDEIYDLQQYIISECKVNCDIGSADVDDTKYPLVQILFEEDGTANFMLTKELTFDMPVTLRLTVSKGQELQSFKILDKILLKINQFNDHKGNKLEGTISPEYNDEIKTYVIDIQYNLKILIHDKET